MLIAASQLIVAPNWKLPKCPLTSEWILVAYSHYGKKSAIKRNKLCIHTEGTLKTLYWTKKPHILLFDFIIWNSRTIKTIAPKGDQWLSGARYGGQWLKRGMMKLLGMTKIFYILFGLVDIQVYTFVKTEQLKSVHFIKLKLYIKLI